MHPGLEYEPSTDESSQEDEGAIDELLLPPAEHDKNKRTDTKLVVVFCLMVVVGAGNAVFNKLIMVPMYNYPIFLNLFGVLLYIPLTFAYIVPVARYGLFNNAITAEQLAMPKRPFAIMGCLDCLAGLMQMFAAVYLPGPLLILLPQAAIPISLVFSKQILGERYRLFQYVGAVVVLTGILVVLEPVITHRHSADNVCEAINIEEDCTICQVESTREDCLSHRLDGGSPHFDFSASYLPALNDNNGTSITDDDYEGEPLCQWVASSAASGKEEGLILVWSLIMILSCVPMTLSSIYKQIALGDGMEVDPVFLNGWIVVFQLIFSIILAVPSGMASSPPVEPVDLPRNIFNGIRCYFGKGSIETGCHPDDMCSSHAALFVNTALVLSILYNILMMYILKYGSTNLLYLALTVMVPIGNLAFALPFMPQTSTLHVSDVLGLVVIMTGLVLYRFADTTSPNNSDTEKDSTQVLGEDGAAASMSLRSLREPLLTNDV